MLFREDTVARADAEAIRKGVGFYRWTHDLVEITGKDALEVLQKIYISDISKVAVGRSKYTASLDENGEIIDDVIVVHMADGLYWVSDLYGPRLLPWIEQHKGEADIHAKIITYDWDMYAVQGPDSLKALEALEVDDDAPETEDRPATGCVLISGGDAWLRTGPGTQYDKAGVAKSGDKLAYANEDNWVPVFVEGRLLWVSGKYARLEG